MSKPIRLLALAGSTRRDSFNKKLVKIAASGARKAGAEVTEIDLANLPMPLFDQDLESEEGMPENAVTFKQLMIDHDGFIISAPEYNSSISGVLKNALDWASRRSGDEPPLVAFSGKTTVLMSASPGSLGGLRGLVHVRAILGNLKVLVLPEQRAISSAFKAFDYDGNLRDEKDQATIEGLGARLFEVTSKLKQSS
jgi:NAD(P)H-dependent FMN reductase